MWKKWQGVGLQKGSQVLFKTYQMEGDYYINKQKSKTHLDLRLWNSGKILGIITQIWECAKKKGHFQL